MMKSDTRMVTTEPFVKLSTPNAPLEHDSSRVSRVPDRLNFDGVTTLSSAEEVLIVDDRSALSPAQAVENKLSRMLVQSSQPVSHLQMRSMLRAR